jgi:hypothetical protein
VIGRPFFNAPANGPVERASGLSVLVGLEREDCAMPESPRSRNVDQEAANAAQSLGRAATGRELTAEETDAMLSIIKAAAEALRHGFVKRLAERVRSERDTENVEEFFEDVIKPE